MTIERTLDEFAFFLIERNVGGTNLLYKLEERRNKEFSTDP